MATAATEPLGLTGDHFHVRGHLLLRRYKVYDEDGELVLTAKRKLFKLKEELPFNGPDGDPVFTVKAQQVLDIAGDYVLTAHGTDRPLVVLQKEFTFFHHKWRLLHPETRAVLALVESDSRVLDFLRHVFGPFSILPYTYHVHTPDGRAVAAIRERWTFFRQKYDVEVLDIGDLPREGLVAAAIAVDVLESQG